MGKHDRLGRVLSINYFRYPVFLFVKPIKFRVHGITVHHTEIFGQYKRVQPFDVIYTYSKGSECDDRVTGGQLATAGFWVGRQRIGPDAVPGHPLMKFHFFAFRDRPRRISVGEV